MTKSELLDLLDEVPDDATINFVGFSDEYGDNEDGEFHHMSDVPAIFSEVTVYSKKHNDVDIYIHF